MKLSELRIKYNYLDDLMKKGIFTDTDRPYFTGYDYCTLYDWDQYFEAIVQAYMGWDHTLASNGITIFLDHQLDSGHIPRSVPHGGIHEFEHVKPFLAQTTLIIHRFYNDLSWFSDVYMEKMQKYLDYWLVEMDPGEMGLSAWKSAPHTGMDNQHDRAGWWEDMMSRGVNLNCYLVRECLAFASLLELKGEKDLGCYWRANTWMPTNYMIYHSLHQYGYPVVARSLVYQTKKLLEKSGNRERYLSDTGEDCGLDPFWGWSLLGYFFEYEESCGYDITELTDQILTEVE